jgi:colanic acid biosynthesis glycosyl transferase WcaI
MQHIIVVSAVFPPELVVSARTSAELGDELQRQGHTVTVAAPFPSRPAGKLFPGYSRKLYQRECLQNGVEIIRCFSTLSSESRVSSRLLENLSFGVTSGWRILVSKRPRVIYANTWPLLATGILFLVSKLRRIPLVISVQDVYPEALIAQGRIRADGLLARLMRWLDGLMARHCAHVIVISERFVQIYRNERGMPSERLSLVPNWIDGDMIDVEVTRQQFQQRTGIGEDDFLLVYGGNVGVAAGVETVVEAVRLLKGEGSVRLLIAGSGSQLAACRELAQQIPDQPVLFHSPWLAEETSEVLRAADLLILPTQGEQSLASVPSKLLSYMLAGRPILAAALPNSDLADMVRRSQCGWVVEPDRPDVLAEQIKKIRALDPVERQQKGDMGRAYVLENFTKDVCVPKVIQILESAIQ